MSPFKRPNISKLNVVRRKENDLSFKIGITVQPVLVSQKFMEQVVVSKKCNRESLINNSWLIRHMICSMRIMLAILQVIFTNTLSKKRTRRLANNFWRPMGACAIWMKTNSHPMQMLHKVWMPWERDAVDQLTESTPQHEKRFHFSKTSSLKTLDTFAPFFHKCCSSQ